MRVAALATWLLLLSAGCVAREPVTAAEEDSPPALAPHPAEGFISPAQENATRAAPGLQAVSFAYQGRTYTGACAAPIFLGGPCLSLPAENTFVQLVEAGSVCRVAGRVEWEADGPLTEELTFGLARNSPDTPPGYLEHRARSTSPFEFDWPVPGYSAEEVFFLVSSETTINTLPLTVSYQILEEFEVSGVAHVSATEGCLPPPTSDPAEGTVSPTNEGAAHLAPELQAVSFAYEGTADTSACAAPIFLSRQCLAAPGKNAFVQLVEAGTVWQVAGRVEWEADGPLTEELTVGLARRSASTSPDSYEYLERSRSPIEFEWALPGYPAEEVFLFISSGTTIDTLPLAVRYDVPQAFDVAGEVHVCRSFDAAGCRAT